MKFEIIANTTGTWRVRNGHLEAPVTMMVEGVHHGTAGPIYWPASVLRQYASRWNNTPVTLNHPVIDDRPVSVNYSRAIQNEYIIGTVTNCRYDANIKGIKGTIRVPSSSRIAGRIQQLSEVSIGTFGEQSNESGTWNGERYTAVATSMTRDHLAILEGVGACSWDKGCGIRANSVQEQNIQVFKQAFKQVLSEKMKEKENEMSNQPQGTLLPTQYANQPETDEDKEQRKRAWEQSGQLMPTMVFQEFREAEASEPNKKQNSSDNEVLLPTRFNK